MKNSTLKNTGAGAGLHPSIIARLEKIALEREQSAAWGAGALRLPACQLSPLETAAWLAINGERSRIACNRAGINARAVRLGILSAEGVARGVGIVPAALPALGPFAGRAPKPLLGPFRGDDDSLALLRSMERAMRMADCEALSGLALVRARGAADAAQAADAEAAGDDCAAVESLRAAERRASIARASAAAHAAGLVPAAASPAAARGPWAGAALLERGCYRRALARAERSARRWVAKNSAGARAISWGGRGARAEDSGAQGDALGAGLELAGEVAGIYRAEFVAVVPRLAAALRRWRGGRDSVARLVAGARRLAYRQATAAAAVALYRLRGRDGRETAVGLAPDDARGHVGCGAWVGGGAVGKAAGGNSDVRALHSGGVGFRHGVDHLMLAAVGAAMQAAGDAHARAGLGGKGSGPMAEGARALAGVATCVDAAILGEALLPDDAAGLSSGPQGGIGDAWRQKIKTFRDAAGVPVPRDIGAAARARRALAKVQAQIDRARINARASESFPVAVRAAVTKAAARAGVDMSAPARPSRYARR